MSYPLAIIDGVINHWHKAPAWRRAIYIALVPVCAVAFVVLFPTAVQLMTRFTEAAPWAQTAFMVILLLAVIGLTVAACWELANKKVLNEKVNTLTAELTDKAAALQQHEDRMVRLLDVESRSQLWQRQPEVPAPAFVPKAGRTTRFLTVLNLKGGVGKTTIAANLAAGLGLAGTQQRVLLVDVDFQGTLGSAVVRKDLGELQRQHNGFVGRLPMADDPDDALFGKLLLPMEGVQEGKVILASENLDLEDFQLQARFFVDPKNDPRFRFRKHFHREEVFRQFDVVIFDCPPRITTSVVNALACSDAVLIPTRLDSGSIEAVPRTVEWLKSLWRVCTPEVIGVVANHTTVWRGELGKSDKTAYSVLTGVVESVCGKGKLFKTAIHSRPNATATVTADGQAVFAKFVTEFRQRMSR